MQLSPTKPVCSLFFCLQRSSGITMDSFPNMQPVYPPRLNPVCMFLKLQSQCMIFIFQILRQLKKPEKTKKKHPIFSTESWLWLVVHDFSFLSCYQTQQVLQMIGPLSVTDKLAIELKSHSRLLLLGLRQPQSTLWTLGQRLGETRQRESVLRQIRPWGPKRDRLGAAELRRGGGHRWC